MTYSYYCDDCEVITEADFPMEKQPHEIPCACCSGPAWKRITGGNGFILKGWFPGKSGL